MPKCCQLAEVVFLTSWGMIADQQSTPRHFCDTGRHGSGRWTEQGQNASCSRPHSGGRLALSTSLGPSDTALLDSAHSCLTNNSWLAVDGLGADEKSIEAQVAECYTRGSSYDFVVLGYGEGNLRLRSGSRAGGCVSAWRLGVLAASWFGGGNRGAGHAGSKYGCSCGGSRPGSVGQWFQSIIRLR